VTFRAIACAFATAASAAFGAHVCAVATTNTAIATTPLARLALSRIAVDTSGTGLVDSAGQAFRPFGFNYDRDHKMRLLEEYWDAEWTTVEEDFLEMKALGANIVRIHLQFAKFMENPQSANEQSLARLERLADLADEIGIYLDVTGLACYRKSEQPSWYSQMSEQDRWNAQAAFWDAVAARMKGRKAVAFLNLMNEPFVPDKPRASGDWLTGELAGFSYVQAITLDPAGRPREEIAQQWIGRMAAAIRKRDPDRLITVGMLPEAGSGFDPRKVSSDLDLVCVHLYPESKDLRKTSDTLALFSVGKPLIVEECFPIHCSSKELSTIIRNHRKDVAGWISFYWGETMPELKASKDFGDLILLDWLKSFRPAMIAE
jgi:hypothetical protein